MKQCHCCLIELPSHAMVALCPACFQAARLEGHGNMMVGCSIHQRYWKPERIGTR